MYSLKRIFLSLFTVLLVIVTSDSYGQCTSSSSLSSTAASETSANLSWSAGGGSSWNIQYGPTGFTLGGGSTATSSSTSTTISGLMPNVIYDVYVQDNCGGGSLSSWTGPVEMHGTVYPCDGFDDYSTGLVDPQSILFDGWYSGGGNGDVSTQQASSGSNSLKVHTSGSSGYTDIIARPGTYNTGVHIVSFDFLMPAGYGGYYNILHSYTATASNVWAIEVYLDSSGVAEVQEGSNGTGDIGEYEIYTDAWNTVDHVINLDDDTAFIMINGSFTDVGWEFSLGSSNFGDQFNAVNFYSAAPAGLTPLVYFDDFCIIDAPLNDVGVSAFVESPPFCGDSNYAVTAVLTNYAYNSLTGFDVDVEVTGATTSSSTYTYNGTLHPGQSDTVVVATINNAAGGIVNYTITSDLTGDTDTTNDELVANGFNYVSSPSVNLGPDVDYCSNESVSLTLNAQNSGSAYLWSTGSTSQTISVDTAGDYWVAITNSNNCTFIDSVIVTEYEAPSVDLGPDTSYCDDSSIGLYLNAGPTIHDYIWNTGDSTNSLYVTLAGTYAVTATASNGCPDVDTILVEELEAPVIPIGDTAFCGGDTFLLNAGNPGATYVWSEGGAVTQVIEVFSEGTYTVTVTGANGCVSEATAEVSVNIKPYVDLGPNIGLIPGHSTILNAGNSGASFLWSTGETTMTISVTQGGTYSVTVTSDEGCSGSDQVKVTIVTGEEELERSGLTIYPNPTRDLINITYDAVVIRGTILQLHDMHGKSVRSMMVDGSGLTTMDLNGLSPGVYLLHVQDEGGRTFATRRVLKF